MPAMPVKPAVSAVCRALDDRVEGHPHLRKEQSGTPASSPSWGPSDGYIEV